MNRQRHETGRKNVTHFAHSIGTFFLIVIAALGAAIPLRGAGRAYLSEMAGTSPAMTNNDVERRSHPALPTRTEFKVVSA